MKNFPPLLDHQPPSSPLHRELVWWFNRSFIHIQWNTDKYVDSLRPGWGESPDAVTPSCPVALWSLGAAGTPSALLFISLAPLLALLSEAIILGLCTSFLPHLRRVRMGNGRRSLQFSLVADLTCEVLLFYSGIIRLWEIYPYSLHTHSVIRAREVGSLHWAECSGLLPEALRKAGTHQEAWWAATTAGRVHPGAGGGGELNGSQYIYYFSGSPNIHVSHKQVFSSLEKLLISFKFSPFFDFPLKLYIRVIEDFKTSK